MFPAYFVLWLILNGRVTLELVLVGLVVCSALALFTAKMTGHTIRYEMTHFFCALKYVGYFFQLMIEICKSGFHVITLVLHPSREIQPKLIYFNSDIWREGLRVMYANSITLTPGTITVELSDGCYRVHALDASFLDGIADNSLTRKLKRLEGRQV
ncbi:MAG: Na+/H+ antiporter subunit E [Clostridia bacterium]